MGEGYGSCALAKWGARAEPPPSWSKLARLSPQFVDMIEKIGRGWICIDLFRKMLFDAFQRLSYSRI
jgi:hypothetical protein